MGVTDSIIKKLKDIKWEEKSKTEIESERIAMKGLKISVPFLTMILTKFLRDQLTGPGGHAKDDLAKRMFNHYLDEGGKDFILTLDDMKHMNGVVTTGIDGIDIRKKDLTTVNPDFAAGCSKAKSTSTPQTYSGKMLWGWDNGAIANYTITYAGTITATSGVCQWDGTVSYFDRFDLDPRWGWTDTNPQGRSRGGERRTRIGYILDLGDDYDMKSPTANVWQKETDNHISFTGSVVSTPKASSAGDI